MMDSTQALEALQQQMRACRRCPDMQPPVVLGRAVLSPILSIGQAPGDKEGALGRPFAWTAGKTLFKWFAHIGVTEEEYRSKVYMAAICRCFPGKKPKGGDRVPNMREIQSCTTWLEREVALLRPRLIIPIGKLAIGHLMPVRKLNEVVGREFELECWGQNATVIPLPHPSGASTWHRSSPGKALLAQALQRIARHPVWREQFERGDE